MGFLIRTYVCEKCGKEFKKIINLYGNICRKCRDKEINDKIELERPIRGYASYYYDVFQKSYSTDEIPTIIEHRDGLIEKFRQPEGITRDELRWASDNYKQLTDEQAAEVIARALLSFITPEIGASHSRKFFCPNQYEKMIVDAEDIFAVGFTSDHRMQIESSEAILCAVFTNDPYVPVFPMVYVEKIGFFGITKSKKGRAAVASLFENICPNLTYPVEDIKQLKKQIKKEDVVKGKLSKEFMLEQIEKVSVGSGIFNTKKMRSDLDYYSAKMLEEMGYMKGTEISQILKLDKMFNRNFWSKHLKRLFAE